MIAVLNWSLDHWAVFFLLAAFGVFEGVRDFFLDAFQALAGIGERRHERRMEELRLQAPPAGPSMSSLSAAGSAKKPGPCVHRNVRPVIGADETLVGWLCTCDTQLPPDWAVREEDL